MAEKITEFLLDTALTLGEGIIKVAAPEIIKAIDATNDSISSQTLDLAKALDLSGAFIPGNPLAFGPALKLAKSLTSVIAGDDQKEVIDAIGARDTLLSLLPHENPFADQPNPHAQSGWRNRQHLS